MTFNLSKSAEPIIVKSQYPMSNGVWVIAECERCGRGFITVNKNITRDPYLPAVGSNCSFPAAICNGRIIRLTEDPARPLEIEMQHD